jgi:hypothetical protein
MQLVVVLGYLCNTDVQLLLLHTGFAMAKTGLSGLSFRRDAHFDAGLPSLLFLLLLLKGLQKAF